MFWSSLERHWSIRIRSGARLQGIARGWSCDGRPKASSWTLWSSCQLRAGSPWHVPGAVEGSSSLVASAGVSSARPAIANATAVEALGRDLARAVQAQSSSPLSKQPRCTSCFQAGSTSRTVFRVQAAVSAKTAAVSVPDVVDPHRAALTSARPRLAQRGRRRVGNKISGSHGQ